LKTPEDEAFEEIERIQRTRTNWVPLKKPQDEIIEMARQCGFERLGHDDCDLVCYPEEVEAFAKLIAEAEREACAEICKKHADVYAMLEQNPTTKSAWAACIDNLDAIRARGEA
jgi:hypothetical protein